MNAGRDQVLQALGAGGERADGLARAICGLVIEAGKLGELELLQVIGVDGALREIRIPPAHWFDRLAKGLELGAFDRPTPAKIKRIVERILAGPPAET